MQYTLGSLMPDTGNTVATYIGSTGATCSGSTGCLSLLGKSLDVAFTCCYLCRVAGLALRAAGLAWLPVGLPVACYIVALHEATCWASWVGNWLGLAAGAGLAVSGCWGLLVLAAGTAWVCVCETV